MSGCTADIVAAPPPSVVVSEVGTKFVASEVQAIQKRIFY